MPRRRNPVRTLFKLENLNNDSVIIIKAGSVMDTAKNRKILANRLIQKNCRDVLILSLTSLDDVSILDEKQMNAMGWQKVPKVEPESVKEPINGP